MPVVLILESYEDCEHMQRKPIPKKDEIRPPTFIFLGVDKWG